MEDAIRVLHVVGRLNIGGAESRIMDLYRNMDRDRIQFDFMQHMDEEGAYQEEVERLGGHVYHVPRFRIWNERSYRKSWERFFAEHPEIKVVHGHMTSTAGIYLPVARKTVGAYTIAHARSAGVDKGPKGAATKFLRRDLSHRCDQCFACSALAAEAVFGRKAVEEGLVKIVPNAVEVDKFAYDPEVRGRVRKGLGIEDDFVIGHVGRFDAVKNHGYMLEILAECVKRRENVRMVFVGDGPLRGEIKRRAEEMGVGGHVLFTGNRRNVCDYYQAFDFFILPSFYEGLPGTAIEAQVSGLRGILSDRVTHEAVVTKLMAQKSIDLPAAEWAREILDTDISGRKSMRDEVRRAGFDAKEQAAGLSRFYRKVAGG